MNKEKRGDMFKRFGWNHKREIHSCISKKNIWYNKLDDLYITISKRYYDDIEQRFTEFNFIKIKATK